MELFTQHEHALVEMCPQCNSELTIKHSKRGPFLGCVAFPVCDFTRALHQNDGHIVKELGLPCPECANELVLRQGRFGMFIGCSSFPECHHIEPLNQQEPESVEPLAKCPECKKGQLIERQSRFGKTFYACDGYPKCRFAVNHLPVAGECSECHFPLLVERNMASGTRYQCADKKCNNFQK
jgi:putative DNA topoisomerase